MSKGHIRWVWNLWKRRKGLIALLFLLTLASSAAAVAIPYAAKLILDSVEGILASGATRSEGEAELSRALLFLVAAGLGGLVASLFPGIRGATNSVFEHLIRSDYFAKALRKGASFFQRFRTADVATRLTDDIADFPRLAWFLCSGIFRAVESIAKIAFCLVAMLLLSPGLTFWTLLPLPLMLVFFYVLQDRVYDSFKRNQEAVSDLNAQLELSFSGSRIIKAYSCEGRYGRFFDQALGKRFKTEMAVVKLDTLLRLIYVYIDYFGQIGVLIAGGFMAISGDITVGTYYAFYNYLAMLVFPFLDIPQLLVSGKRAFVNIDRLEEMAAHPDPAPRGKAGYGSFAGAALEGVSLRYEGRAEPALDAVDLEVARGERVLLMGAVGSGKSSAAKLLAGVLDPDSGRVLVNGRPCAEYDPAFLASRIGYVPQESLLFSGTVRDNLMLGLRAEDGSLLPGLSEAEERLAEAIRAARLEREIAEWPAGLDTVLGQRGSMVSGGQRQRLAVARALALRPELLILDDVTASLDAANEEAMMAALSAMNPGMAIVAVSHRLSSARYVDRIVLMGSGRVICQGSPQAMLRERAFADFASKAGS
jgi:ATP-binding cassette subfamily B protein